MLTYERLHRNNNATIAHDIIGTVSESMIDEKRPVFVMDTA